VFFDGCWHAVSSVLVFMIGESVCSVVFGIVSLLDVFVGVGMLVCVVGGFSLCCFFFWSALFLLHFLVSSLFLHDAPPFLFLIYCLGCMNFDGRFFLSQFCDFSFEIFFSFSPPKPSFFGSLFFLH